MDYQPYLGWGLNNFEDIINAFTKYPDGGWWVKKIDYKDAFHREITDGPFTEKEAKEKSNNWNKFFRFKDITTAIALSFNDLICENNISIEVKENLYIEYIWRPPSGAELMCFLNGKEKVLLYYKNNNKDNNSFEKFKMYVLESNKIKLIEYKDFYIFYKDKDYMAFKQANKLKELVNDFSENLDELWFLYEYAITKSNSKNVNYLPEYIKDFNFDDEPYDLNFFKKFSKNNESKDERINKLINCLKNNKRDFVFNANINNNNNNNYNIGYKFPLLYDEKDYDIKNITISYDKNKTFILKFNNNILTAPKDKIANLFIKDKIDIKNIYLILFIAKVLNIDTIIIKDSLTEPCKCNDFDKPIYTNILNFIINEESIYSEMGFIEQNIDTREEIIDEYRYKLINDEVFKDKSLKELVVDYFNGYCQYIHVCELLHFTTVEIYNKLKNNCLEFYIDLRKIKLINLKNKILF
jgi:hypothetical protein